MQETKAKCFAALYGSGEPPSASEVKAALAAEAAEQGATESEYDHQRRLHVWLVKRDILHFHCPNELIRNEAEGRAQGMIGMYPGVPDLIIPLARKPYHALVLELKRQEGVVSGAQQWWLAKLSQEGYRALVSRSFDESVGIVEDYLSLPRW